MSAAAGAWLGIEILTWQSIAVSLVLCGAWAAFYAHFVHERQEENAPFVTSARFAFLDNAKFFIMPTIVLTHMFAMSEANERLIGHSQIQHWLASTHTRIYCFLSGWIACKTPSFLSVGRLFIRCGAPYVVYCMVLYPIYCITSDSSENDRFTATRFIYIGFEAMTAGTPAPTWYLVGLVWWVLASWTILWLPPGQRLVVAIAVAAVFGYTELHTWFPLMPEEIPLYFPVFIAGQVCQLDVLVRQVPGGIHVAAVAATLLLATFLIEVLTPFGTFSNSLPDWWWNDGLDTPRVYGSHAEALFFWTRFTARTAWCMTKGFLFLMMLPRTAGFYTELGERSLYPFMLHLPLVGTLNGLLSKLHLSSSFIDQAFFWFVALATAVGLTLLLSTWQVRASFAWCFEPSLSTFHYVIEPACCGRRTEGLGPPGQELGAILNPRLDERRTSDPPETAMALPDA